MSNTSRIRAHAINRARERYGATITTTDCQAIEELIRASNGKCLGTIEKDRSIWEISYNDHNLIIVYNKDIHMIVTFLPYTKDTFSYVRRKSYWYYKYN